MGRKKDEPLVYNSFEELLDILAEERKKTLKKRKNVQIVLAIYGLMFCLMTLAMIFTHAHFSGFGGMFGGLGAMIAAMYATTEKQRKGMQALTEFEDVRAVPHLITALEYNDSSVKVIAANALTGLLPGLRASDAPLFSKEHYAILNRALKNDLNMKTPVAARLRIAVLKALQQVGDGSSLAVVEEMAVGKGKAAGKSEMQWAAQECLPYLRLRAENQHQTQTLLRASDGNMTPADMLLRPASDQPASTLHANELLRVPASEADTQTVVQPVLAVHEARQVEQELRLH